MDTCTHLNVWISGFGRFGDVIENPTSILVAKLHEQHAAGNLKVDGMTIHMLKVLDVHI